MRRVSLNMSHWYFHWTEYDCRPASGYIALADNAMPFRFGQRAETVRVDRTPALGIFSVLHANHALFTLARSCCLLAHLVVDTLQMNSFTCGQLPRRRMVFFSSGGASCDCVSLVQG